MTTETPTTRLMRWCPIDPAVHACWKLITDAIERGMLVDGDVDQVRHHVAAGREILLDELALERIGDALRVRFHDREATCAPDDLLAELTKVLEGVGSISGFDGAMEQPDGAMFAIDTALDAAQSGAMRLEPLASALRAGRELLEEGRTQLALGPDERGVDAFVKAELGQLDRIADVLRDGSATPARLRRLGEDFLEHEPAGRVAMAAGFHGAREARQLVTALASAPNDARVVARAREAAAVLALALRSLDADYYGPFGSRFAAYLDWHAQMLARLGK